jgi:hypothetical protein
MIKSRPEIVIETSGGIGTEEFFSIGDLGFIMNILRDKMYSNPINTICREISSNARDAHREVGTPERPIQIHLPNPFDSHLKIKDWGPGIVPSRMSEVFIKLGLSTKTGDNAQTGGFGIGGKTPFAYTDQFAIITTTPDALYWVHEAGDDGIKSINVRRNYIAYIDETDVGKMRLVTAEITDEETGTEIVIPVKKIDWNRFERAVLEVTRFWNTIPGEQRPALIGKEPAPQYPDDEEPLLRGPNWSVIRVFSCSTHGAAVVDGIAYPLKSENITGLSDSCSALVSHSCLFLNFRVGELDLASNREQLQYSDKTNAIIKARLVEIQKAAQDILQQRVSGCKTFREAIKVTEAVRESFHVAIPSSIFPVWNGHAVPRATIRLANNVEQAINIRVYWHGPDNRLESNCIDSIHVKEDTTIILNDLGKRVSKERILKFLNGRNRREHSVEVISFKDGPESADGRLNAWSHGLASTRPPFSLNTTPRLSPPSLVDIRMLGLVKLSSIELPKKITDSVAKRAKITGFKINPSYKGSRKCDRCLEPTASIDKDNGSGAFVVVEGHGHTILPSGRFNLNANSLAHISKLTGMEIYAVRPSDPANLGPGWVPFDKAFEKKFEEMLVATGSSIEKIAEMHATTHTGSDDIQSLIKSKLGSLDSSGIMHKHFSDSQAARIFIDQTANVWELATYACPEKKQCEKNYDEVWEEVIANYPLIQIVDYYHIRKGGLTALIDYINLIDKDAAEKEAQKFIDNESLFVVNE